MSYQIIQTGYFSSDWYLFDEKAISETTNFKQVYKALGSFSQGTNWEKVFTLGNQVNNDLQMSEQQIIDDIKTFRRQRNK